MSGVKQKPRLIYLCNAIDESTCRERGITTDSPAATRKVIEVTKAMRDAGVRGIVLSLGRGRQNGTGRYFPARVKRVEGVPVVYAPFLDRPHLTHLLSMFALLPLLFRLRQRRVQPVLLAYNRLVHYWLAMELSRWLGFRTFLDLEDGAIDGEGSPFRQRLTRFMTARFDALCGTGAMLAASALGGQYRGNRTVCCYGVADVAGSPRSFPESGELLVHIGGTLQYTTGAQLLIDAIRYMRAMPEAPKIRFVITGSGESAEALAALAADAEKPAVEFLGKVSRGAYRQVIGEAHVGLALKLQSGDLADTTFPSKVIEITSTGMLLVTTRISDVPILFGEEGALYLDDETPSGLAALFKRFDSERSMLGRIAAQGQFRIREHCSSVRVGESLKQFFFSSAPVKTTSSSGGEKQ